MNTLKQLKEDLKDAVDSYGQALRDEEEASKWTDTSLDKVVNIRNLIEKEKGNQPDSFDENN